MTRKTATVGGLVLLLALLLGACAMAPPAEAPEAAAPMPPSPTPEPPTPTTAPAPTPEMDPDQAMAQELWTRMQESGYQERWTLVEGKGRLYRGLDPHGALLSTYLNDPAAEAMRGQVGTMPDGAMIIKENYMPDATLAAITVMYKEAGYDPDHNDWFWVKYNPDGSIAAAGKPAGCISCHGSRRTNDYIFTFPLAPIQVEATEATDADRAMAEELWATLQEVAYQTNWQIIPIKGEFYQGQGPHGMLLTTYLNEAAWQGFTEKPGGMPAGSVIVKENYTPDKELAAITVMAKREGYDPDHNDWFWVKYNPDGSIAAAGKPVGCIACHGSGASNDYVFTFPVAPINPEGPPPPVDMGQGAEEPSAEEEGAAKAMAETMPPMPPVEEVAAIVARAGCAGCHTIPGIENAMGSLGPDWCVPAGYVQRGEKGLDFLRESILDPNAFVEEGFPPNIMPGNFGELLTDEEVEVLVAYIANLDCPTP